MGGPYVKNMSNPDLIEKKKYSRKTYGECPTKTLSCTHCGKLFEKNIYVYNSFLKTGLVSGREPITKGREVPFFCSHPCAAMHQHDSKADKYTPWRYFFSTSKSRAKRTGFAHEITIDQVIDLWEKQKGICPYMEVKMLMPVTAAKSKTNGSGPKELAFPNTVSLDRIDPYVGYIMDNVELVCLAVNYAKNRWSCEQMKDFFDKKNSNDEGAWHGII